MITKLTNLNFRKVNEYKKEIGSHCPISGLTLCLWTYYGYDIFFEYFKEERIVLFYGIANDDLKQIETDEFVNRFNGKYFVIYSFSHKDVSLDFLVSFGMKKLRTSFQNIIPIFNGLSRDFLQGETLTLKHKELYSWSANFIYETEKLKTLGGKSLQKKRNNLNYFIKNHGTEYTVRNYDEKTDKKDVINFLSTWDIKTNRDAYNLMVQANIDIIEKFYNVNDFKGSVMVEDKTSNIVGFTLVYLNEEISEIIIEQTMRHIRGAYQFLLTRNLINNDITSPYIDRQDDASSKNINDSKKSYHPIKEVTRVCIEIED
ncbi:phosphatidylglycerol lysyltransferase domain-containing protein [Ureaplasma canigenitalium]|uniref:phosphatidylglycerol lysyltransferase domain-containing protein n=1 Tax=Ureaplasma canigenitalium TaxID=42092 RepID=UPI0004E16614|nr:phosphatidylglycerol lysyltransferase domain-containing protein [Ureaplasma canigenitalium]